MWQGENLKVALMSRCFDLLHRAVLGSFNRLPLLCLSKHPAPPFPKLHPPKIILVMGTLLTMALLSPFRLHTFPPFSHPSIISFQHFRYLSIFCFAPFSHFSRTVYKFVCCLFTDISENLPTPHLLHISQTFTFTQSSLLPRVCTAVWRAYARTIEVVLTRSATSGRLSSRPGSTAPSLATTPSTSTKSSP